MLHFISNGDEYTTRTRLLKKYPIAPTSLQMLLRTIAIAKLVDGNKFYFLKREAEAVVEACLKRSAGA